MLSSSKSFRQKNTCFAKSVLASFDILKRHRTSPNIKQNKLSSPYNIYKVPIENGKIQSQTFMRFHSSFKQNKITNSLVNSSDLNMQTMETCCQIKSTPKHSVTECEGSCGVFSVLTKHKEPSETNSEKLKMTTLFQVRAIKSMLCSICSKERTKQNKGVSQWQPCPMERNNSKRRPLHSHFNTRHNSYMHKSPQQSKEKNCFTYNKINYS